MASKIDSFATSIAQFNWFHAIGQPLLEDGVVRLDSFDDWPGPETKIVDALFVELQRFKDDLKSISGDRISELEVLWHNIYRSVIEVAGSAIKYDPKEDAWNARWAATNEGAWTAALMAWHLALDQEIPELLKEVWSWFQKGRWPAGFAVLDQNGKGKGWLVL